MTPKEKAKELVDKIIDKMFNLRDGYNSIEVFDTAKQCALIAINEILDELDEILNITGSSFIFEVIDYWQEVKQEIELL